MKRQSRIPFHCSLLPIIVSTIVVLLGCAHVVKLDKYKKGGFHKAIAVAPNGASWQTWNYTTIEEAIKAALKECKNRWKTPCKIFEVDEMPYAEYLAVKNRIAEELSISSKASVNKLDKYKKGGFHKAIAVAPNGASWQSWSYTTVGGAIRSALKGCENRWKTRCEIIEVDEMPYAKNLAVKKRIAEELPISSKAPVASTTKAKPKKYRLFVKTQPSDATIKIMNIRERFKQGIQLLPGQYVLQIEKKGYTTRKDAIHIGSSDLKLSYILDKFQVFDIDTKPPKIKIYSQRGINVLSKAKHTIKGKAEDESGVAIVEVNRKEAKLDENGSFLTTILLKPGRNHVVITATDVYENQATKTIVIERSSGTLGLRPDPESIITGKYFAFLIAVEDYQGFGISDLNQPIKDANTIKDVLQKCYIFDSENIILLENPNRDKIIDTFDQLSRKITKHDNLLIFYAGHGYWDKRFKQGYWLPSNASKNSRSKWLSNSTIRDYIRGIRAKHTLLVSDACFSGGIFKTRTAFNDALPATNELYKLPSRKAMTSGTLTEVPDRSVFVEYFVKRLRENKEKYLSSEQLFITFKDAVINNSPTRQIPQFGEIREAGDEGGDFIFVNRK